ncbi:MAG TPA: alkaline phosphatase family protein [Kofleriaceae bacterium]|nr:alkaline phosphatase family protein [Kofleriaceae bacterium]
MPDTTIHDHRDEDVSSTEHHQHDPAQGGGFVVDHRPSAIKHVFVLMMENRSFDHMLGFSRIEGTDAATGKPTVIEGLHGDESNLANGTKFTVHTGAADRLSPGPSHGFDQVLVQLCGDHARYHGAAYPPINNSGFAQDYAGVDDMHSPGDPLAMFAPDKLPVLTALAREFCVCDHWFSSIPGDTYVNRLFAHLATSQTYEEGPGGLSEGWDQFFDGKFEGKSIFKRLNDAGVKFRIYSDDWVSNVAELADIDTSRDVYELEDMAADLRKPGFDAKYVFIEPWYDIPYFTDGNCQHPVGSVAKGEGFIKAVYEAIRNSPLWESSVLIITWDEHGGFYDHVAPPLHMPTGFIGTPRGFRMDQLGPRVPGLVISPLVPKNLIEHRVMDHCAIPATVERVFGVPPLSTRDARGNAVNHLATLKTARQDTPRTLPAPVHIADAIAVKPPDPSTPIEADPHGNAQAALRAAVRQHLQAVYPAQRPAVIARAKQVKTFGQLRAYIEETKAPVKAKRLAIRGRE